MGLSALEASMTALVDDGRFIGFDETIVLAEGTAFADYLEWLEGTHPEEVELAAQLEWGSVEEAVAAGEARARYVDEWALRSRDSRRHDWIIRPTWGGRPTKFAGDPISGS
jgi:hypothetical protein